MKLKNLYENVDNFQLKKSDGNTMSDLDIFEDRQYMYFYTYVPRINRSEIKNCKIGKDIFNHLNGDGINNTNIFLEYLESCLMTPKISKLIKLIKTNHAGYSGWFIPSTKQVEDITKNKYNMAIEHHDKLISNHKILSSNVYSIGYDDLVFRYFSNMDIVDNIAIVGQILLMRYK